MSCSARYLNPMPSDLELGAFYPTDYYSHQSVAEPDSSWKSRLKKRILPLGTKEPDLPVPGRMLDIGCVSGWMLDHYRQLGWEVEGVEYSPSACAAGRKRALTIHCGSLRDAQLPSSSFDFIRTNHSFEHLSDPHETLDEIARLLKPNGTLFVGVPDTMGLTARLFGREWFYVGAPIHTINYSRDNLSALLERHGFKIEAVRGNSNHGGTVGSLQSWVGNRLRRPVDLNKGPVTWPAFILIGYWTSRLLDLVHLGDCVEITASYSATA
jgi:SAM-dependent methyltransferase